MRHYRVIAFLPGRTRITLDFEATCHGHARKQAFRYVKRVWGRPPFLTVAGLV